RRTRPLRALCEDQLVVAVGGLRVHGRVHDRRHPRLRSLARAHRTPRGAGRRRRMRRAWLAPAIVVALTAGLPAQAADPRHPDWPCHQIKVPSLSVAAMWAGPALDDVGGKWHDDARTAELVATLAARRTSMDDADKLI